MSEEERILLEKKSKQADMSRSDYIRCLIFNENKVAVINKDREIYQVLLKISQAIEAIENEKKIDLGSVKRVVWETCHILSL